MQIANIRKLIGFSLLVSMLFGGSVFAVSSATFVFDAISDPGDLADGPDYDITGVGFVDDGSGCDVVTMIMVDATGGIVDVDTVCLSLIDGTGGSDGDYGSFDGYVPVMSPVTYALYDLTATDLAATIGLGDNDQAYVDYIVANSACLYELFYDETDLSIPAGTPFSLCGGGSSSESAGCTLAAPAGSVVGEAPLGAQVFWAPGKESPGVVLNPGTYIVIGQDESETYYKVMLACQFVWVRKDAMQPSYQAPQNGAALPTRVVG